MKRTGITYSRAAMAAVFTVALCAQPGCGSAGAAPDEPGSGDGGSVSPVAKTVTIKGGRGFECFVYAQSLYCKGNPLNGDLAALIPSAVSYTRVGMGDFTTLYTWDDTLCVGAVVAQRPLSRGPGEGTYCWGEATLNASYALFSVVYGGVNYTDGANGSSDLTYSQTPFVGADMTVTYFATQTATADPIVSDGFGFRTERTEVCVDDGITLTCETVGVGL